MQHVRYARSLRQRVVQYMLVVDRRFACKSYIAPERGKVD